MSASQTASSSLSRWGRQCWHLVGIVVVAVTVGWFLWRIREVVLPLFIAILICVILAPVRSRLERLGLSTSLATVLTLLSFLGLLVLVGLLIVPALIDQTRVLGDQLGEAADRLQRWVAAERPFGFDGSDVQRLRDDFGGVDETSADSLITGAQALGTFVASLLFTIVATFFFLRDGSMMIDWAIRHLAADRRDEARAMFTAIGNALSGYVRGAAMLGVVEGIAIAIIVALVGGDLAIVLGLLTFIGAFVPFVGAVGAGLVAVGVTLVSAGTTPAIIVAVSALVVQQLDNDLLAPMIYGRFLKIHPLAVLASISVGIQVAGLIGAFAAVPVAASVIGVVRVARQRQGVRTLTLPTSDFPG